MQRYYFHAFDERPTRDERGVELAGPSEAKTYAVRFAGELLREAQPGFWDTDVWRVEVTDADGLLLMTLHVTGTLSLALQDVS